MSTFRFGHGTGPDWESAARSCLARLEPGTFSANLGFVYVTDVFEAHLADIVRFLRIRTGVDQWVGTVGLGVCSAGVEYFGEPAVAVLLGRFPNDSFRVFGSVVTGFDGFEAEHHQWCKQARPNFGVVHGDPENRQLSQLVMSLTERMDNGFLVGGIASSRAGHPQFANGLSTGGLSGVLFTRDVAVATRVTQGCSPIGPRHRIDACERNVVVELDERPALDVFYEEVGEVLARNPSQVAGYIFAGLPVRGSDTGDYLVRNLVGIDPVNRLLAIGDNVEVGDEILFCRRDAQTAEEDMQRMLEELKRSLPDKPKGGIYCSCIARGPNLFGANSGELRLIEEELGEFPLVGFFANGEISHNRLYAYTGVLTLFG